MKGMYIMAETKKVAAKTAKTPKTISGTGTVSKKVTAEKQSAAKPKAAVKKTSAKKAPKKPSVTIETICGKVEQMLPKTAPFKEKIAVDIEVWGFEDGSNAKMYIEANNGIVTVSPHTYNEKDFRVAVSFANAKNFIDGKLALKDMLLSSDFYAEGNVVAALKLAALF